MTWFLLPDLPRNCRYTRAHVRHSKSRPISPPTLGPCTSSSWWFCSQISSDSERKKVFVSRRSNFSMTRDLGLGPNLPDRKVFLVLETLRFLDRVPNALMPECIQTNPCIPPHAFPSLQKRRCFIASAL